MSEEAHGGQTVIVVHGLPFDGWKLPGYVARHDLEWIHGGERTLLELAAAAAMNGIRVELRGLFSEPHVAEMEQAAGTEMGRPGEPRLPRATDTVVIPEGTPDPLLLARVAQSPARAVLFLAAAPGLFGWSFDRDGMPDDPLIVDPRSVGRPEQLEAARRFGFELWTNLRAIAEQARAAGLPHHYLGIGRPSPYPEPGEKRTDVVTLAANRWSPLSQVAVTRLRPGVTHAEIPNTSRARVLTAFGEARVFVHPARIEGRSRLCEEARAMGAVPVLLASNRLGEGMDEAAGAVAVGSVDEMAPAVHALLDDPDRLARLATAGRKAARARAAWAPFVRHVGEVLAAPDRDVARFASGRAALAARLIEREEDVRHETATAAEEIHARTIAAREQELRAVIVAQDQRAEEMRRALAAAEARLHALRSRRAVRAALSAASALALARRCAGALTLLAIGSPRDGGCPGDEAGAAGFGSTRRAHDVRGVSGDGR